MESHTLSVSGMTCNNCVNHVQKALLATPGVKAAKVNLKGETANVQTAPGVSRAALVDAIEQTGYKVRESDPHETANNGGKKSGWPFWRR